MNKFIINKINKRLKSSLRTWRTWLAILAIILLGFVLPYPYYSYAYAQQLETRNSKPETGTGTEGVWKSYRFVDGLADNQVDAIIQDKEGVIWFGTAYGGVSRFDGVSWKTYAQKDGLADNDVEDIMQDKEGAIWFGKGQPTKKASNTSTSNPDNTASRCRQ